MKNQAAKSPKNQITTYALNLMSEVLTFWGAIIHPFDQPSSRGRGCVEGASRVHRGCVEETSNLWRRGVEARAQVKAGAQRLPRSGKLRDKAGAQRLPRSGLPKHPNCKQNGPLGPKIFFACGALLLPAARDRARCARGAARQALGPKQGL